MLPDSTQENLASQDIPALSLVFNVPTITAMSIHSRIRTLRTQKGLSMKELGDVVGVSWQTVQQWENEDGTAPKRTRLKKVADALGTTPEYLMNASPSMAWPFKLVDQAKYQSLSDSDRDRIETALIAIAHSLKIDITASKPTDVKTG